MYQYQQGFWSRIFSLLENSSASRRRVPDDSKTLLVLGYYSLEFTTLTS